MFGDIFLKGISLAVPASNPLAPSPLYKTMAILDVQELEEDLEDVKLAALICIFQADANAADVYMVIKCLRLCKACVEDMLPGL